jgi:signal transduction histidine kinase
VLRVADRGIGIPPAARSRVFEEGYRSDAAASVASGLGLGLYIASAIVARHHGALEAAPREGGGTIFTMRLPTAESGQTDADNERRVDAAMIAPHSAGLH